MGILKMLGLYTAEEYGAVAATRDRALTDLASEVEKRQTLTETNATLNNNARLDRSTIETQTNKIAQQNDEIAGLKAELAAADNRADSNQVDAQKWRDRAAREHARRTKSRAPASTPAPKPVAAKAKPKKAAR